MKKILFVMHTLGFGGAERSLVNLLYELPQNEYKADILLFQKRGELLRQLPSGVNVIDTPKKLNMLYSPVKKAGSLALIKIIGTLCARVMRKTRKTQAAYRWKHFYKNYVDTVEDQYDVAIAYGGTELLYFINDKVVADKKLVWIHNDYRTAQYAKDDDRPYLAEMDGIVSISDECVNVLKEEFPEFEKKIYCIANITSSEMVKNMAKNYFPAEYEGERCNILSIGRLSNQKGFDMAVDAAALLKEKGFNFKWHIIGEGELRESLEKKIKDLSLEKNVLLLGTRSNPYPYIKNCSILVQSSRYEGKSVVLDEAKILATPIVVTSYLTVWDQIKDGKEGIITDISADGIANGIITMLTNDHIYKDIRDYLTSQQYGNVDEIKKYISLLDE